MTATEAQTIEALRRDLGGVQCDALGGDNLAIFIVSEFESWTGDDDTETDDCGTWKLSAVKKTGQVLDAIHAHYAAEAARLRESLAKAERDEADAEVGLTEGLLADERRMRFAAESRVSALQSQVEMLAASLRARALAKGGTI